MLEVRDLNVAYGQHRALENVSLRVNPGEIVVILGANGAGKSTLLKTVSGICEGQVEGSITLDGHELINRAPDQIVEEGIALVPEGRGIFGDLSVEENLTLGGYPRRARDEQADILARVYGLFPKLIERRRQIARTMSGGEQQMVAIGRAMMSNPQILTLDEPSLGLSPLLCKELFQNLKTVREAGIGILLVEQNARQSLAIADRGYLLENAHIVHEDKADALMHDPAVQTAYLGAAGAASPHTHDEAMEPIPVSGNAAQFPTQDPVPDTMDVRVKAAKTRSADAILGTSISDLVETASAQSARRSDKSTETAKPTPMDTSEERLQSALKEIEAAAQRARHSRRQRTERPSFSERNTSPAHHFDLPSQTAGTDRPKPVNIEVYRRPRVEIYRRRPGSSDFERD